MASEIQIENDDKDQDPLYTLAIDIWSLGCVSFRLLTHQLPFPEFSTPALGNLDSLKDNVKNGLEGTADQPWKGLLPRLVSVFPSAFLRVNLEGNQPLFNEAITSYTEIRNGVLMYTAGGGRGK